ncbi:tubulin alpha-1 chain [Culex quinquefasciatus]|uniref:Tubulin alpha-1 chain n=1 Tax=Culex quinquefasciatus TaxID=7176 RepID=B0X0P3_CULQU|nr:tubulin alpha-1 chain [Culex quinquefasciatus]|eukprot:XP_001863215.1 tubulin alpha-1 chain [Culex quinquefasciatus]
MLSDLQIIPFGGTESGLTSLPMERLTVDNGKKFMLKFAMTRPHRSRPPSLSRTTGHRPDIHQSEPADWPDHIHGHRLKP